MGQLDTPVSGQVVHRSTWTRSAHWMAAEVDDGMTWHLSPPPSSSCVRLWRSIISRSWPNVVSVTSSRPCDMRLGAMAVGWELHTDEEAMMLDAGSEQADLWGINLYAAEYGATGWLEFDSMMNVRPGPGNRSRSVDDPAVQRRIVAIIERQGEYRQRSRPRKPREGASRRRSRGALDRALEMFDLTLGDERWTTRRKEIAAHQGLNDGRAPRSPRSAP